MLERTIHRKRLLLTVTNIPIYNKQTNLMFTTVCYLFSLLRLCLPLYFRVVYGLLTHTLVLNIH